MSLTRRGDGSDASGQWLSIACSGRGAPLVPARHDPARRHSMAPCPICGLLWFTCRHASTSTCDALYLDMQPGVWLWLGVLGSPVLVERSSGYPRHLLMARCPGFRYGQAWTLLFSQDLEAHSVGARHQTRQLHKAARTHCAPSLVSRSGSRLQVPQAGESRAAPRSKSLATSSSARPLVSGKHR